MTNTMWTNINFTETRESCFFFLFSKIYIIEKEERKRERERDIKMEERENRMKYTLVCPLTRFLSKSRGLVRKRING